MKDPVFESAVADATAIVEKWAGPGDRPPVSVAHQDPETGVITFHLRGSAEQLAHVREALTVDRVPRAVLDRVLATRNRFYRQREETRAELESLVDLVDRVVNDEDLCEMESSDLFRLRRGFDAARRYLMSMPPKLVDAEPTDEDREPEVDARPGGPCQPIGCDNAERHAAGVREVQATRDKIRAFFTSAAGGPDWPGAATVDTIAAGTGLQIATTAVALKLWPEAEEMRPGLWRLLHSVHEKIAAFFADRAVVDEPDWPRVAKSEAIAAAVGASQATVVVTLNRSPEFEEMRPGLWRRVPASQEV